MAKKLDLNKLREEIDKEKQSKNTIPSSLGESIGNGMTPRDTFLNGLLASYNSGQATPSTNLIKVVENKVAEKRGEVKKLVINETAPISNHYQTPSPVNIPQDRDEQMFRDLEMKKNQTLAESIESFQGNTLKSPTSPMVNFGGKQYLTSIPEGHNSLTNMAGSVSSMQINETVLTENVKKVVNNYLSENLGAVFEEAIKGTIIEMYAVERIKEVLKENKDLIKTVVIETIREIQAKNKKNAQS